MTNADWFEHGEEWRLRATLDVAKTKASWIAYEPDVFSDICASLVRSLPHPPAGLSDPKQMYRLDLNLPAPDGKTERFLVPVSVRDGECRITVLSDKVEWTYQSRLSGYVFTGYATGSSWKIPSLEKKVELVLNWQVDPNVNPDSEFDYLAACRAVLADVPPILESEMDVTKVTDIEVRLGKFVGGGLISAGIYSSAKFKALGGTCVAPGGIDG